MTNANPLGKVAQQLICPLFLIGKSVAQTAMPDDNASAGEEDDQAEVDVNARAPSHFGVTFRGSTRSPATSRSDKVF
jgi:hypothetical protein